MTLRCASVTDRDVLQPLVENRHGYYQHSEIILIIYPWAVQRPHSKALTSGLYHFRGLSLFFRQSAPLSRIAGSAARSRNPKGLPQTLRRRECDRLRSLCPGQPRVSEVPDVIAPPSPPIKRPLPATAVQAKLADQCTQQAQSVPVSNRDDCPPPWSLRENRIPLTRSELQAVHRLLSSPERGQSAATDDRAVEGTWRRHRGQGHSAPLHADDPLTRPDRRHTPGPSPDT